MTSAVVAEEQELHAFPDSCMQKNATWADTLTCSKSYFLLIIDVDACVRSRSI